MKRFLPILLVVGLVAGCNDAKTTPPAAATTSPGAGGDEAKIQANLNKLSPEDRALAEAQKYCANETDSLLGSMGAPIKVMVKDQPVFVCCKGCVEDVQKDPDKTLKTVEEIKAKARAEKK